MLVANMSVILKLLYTDQ